MKKSAHLPLGQLAKGDGGADEKMAERGGATGAE